MKVCPFCAEEIQDAAVVCKHCGRALAQSAPQPQVQPEPPVSSAAFEFAKGVALKMALGLLGVGLVLSFVPYPVRALALPALWFGCVFLLDKGRLGARLLIASIAAFILFMPSMAFRSALSDRQKQAHQQQALAAIAVAARANEAAAVEAARSFPDDQASIQARLTVIERATGSKDWATTQRDLSKLQTEVKPLLASTLATSPAVSAIKVRLEAQQTALSTHVSEQRAAAAAAAETARRAAWVPDPGVMAHYCAVYAKQGILDGQADFYRGTLTKRGRAYRMRGQVIGHNAFNAKIAKEATCSVQLDARTGLETYSTSLN